MAAALAQSLMEEFADTTGITGNGIPRRYLWTDAFAVCNFLGLFRETGEDRFLTLARELVGQVHHILGRHRDDDPRRGWISGLSEEEGEQHPTRGGLRIGKPLNERAPHDPLNSRLEWERDGQYFHYLTKWMHALYRMGSEIGESRYQRWAAELAVTAHRAFTHKVRLGGPKRMVWKMSIDLTRPLVSSMGQHDPLDGLVTFLELQTTEGAETEVGMDLATAIADMTEIIVHAYLATDDQLGIGGLLDNATRLAKLIFQHGVKCRDLLHQVLVDAGVSLEAFSHTLSLDCSAERRLAFRELGLSIGLYGLQQLKNLVTQDSELVTASDRLLPYRPLAKQISSFWSNPAHRRSSTWTDHRDINTVMLATSLSPESYLKL